MIKRTVTAVIAIILFIPFLLLAGSTDTMSLIVLCQLIAVPATLEILKMTGLLKKLHISIPCVIVALFVPALTKIKGDEFFAGCAIIFFILAFYMLSCAVFDHECIGVQDYAITFIMVFYVIVASSSIIKLYEQPYGKYVYLLCFIGAWFSDTGAYIAGRAFGKHKLIPSVSPKKTVEGAIGGILFNIIFVGIYIFIVSSMLELRIRLVYVVIAAILMAVVSMLGDLIASLMKRHYNIKDYGDIFPGHGGILDRFDSVLAIAPFLFIMFTLFSDFNLFV